MLFHITFSPFIIIITRFSHAETNSQKYNEPFSRINTFRYTIHNIKISIIDFSAEMSQTTEPYDTWIVIQPQTYWKTIFQINTIL